MCKKSQLVLLLLLCSSITLAQIIDNFIDGDFTVNPSWNGSSSDWNVNADLRLQSNNTNSNSAFYISTVNTKAMNTQWDFYSQITFNPSSANYIDVYLTSSQSDLSLKITTGYFVRVGYTDDEISLYRKDSSGIVTKIIDGNNGVLNTGNNVMKIRVVRNATNQWILSRDISGTGNNYISEGIVTDSTYTSSEFFGILVKQSTVSFYQKHYFDDIEVITYVPDIEPPFVQALTATTANTLEIIFNEPVDPVTSQVVYNYVLSNGEFPISAVRDSINSLMVYLSFPGNFLNHTNLFLTLNNINDLSGNMLTNVNAAFSFFTAATYSILINEFMADPSPAVSLTNNEWIELKNNSGYSINLKGWRIGSSGVHSGLMPSYIILPDSFVIVCTGSALPALSTFGRTIAVSGFPGIDNTGDLLYLQSPQGSIIHAVNFDDTWYQNELKKNGGWTLEMIDSNNPCSGFNNWKASIDPNGGTPGKKNSINGVNKDETLPKLLRAYVTDSINITLIFNEPMDSIKSAEITNYTISDGIGKPINAIPEAPLFEHVILRSPTPLERNKIYSILVSNNTDCTNNTIGTSNTARFGISEHTDSFDIVINEILFNPISNGEDYIELYNRSNKILNLKNIYIANRNDAGSISNIKQLSIEDYLFFPRDHIVVTADKKIVMRDYVAKNQDAFIEINNMPSFNDKAGNVIIINDLGNIVDDVSYSENWHFKLISYYEGVSLERINYDAPSNLESNWHSAATSIGYGTPTYKNSQSGIDVYVKGDITVTPAIISPDNDGIDDYATINYILPEYGYVTNITIFDAAGRPVRYLQRNALSGLKGYYRWDGLGEKNNKLPVGIYIIYTEMFNLKGNTKRSKNIIVVAGKH